MIVGLKDDKGGMTAWAKHIRRAVPDQRQSFEGCDSRRTMSPDRRRSEPEPEPEPEPEQQQQLKAQPEADLVFGGDLNDPSEWVKGVSGGYATVFRADWIGAAVAVKVPHPVPQPQLPVFWPRFTPAQQVQMLDVVTANSARGEAVEDQLSELGLSPIESYAVVQYCELQYKFQFCFEIFY